ncbi:hypothetical protein NPIL_162391 [Nephila pilipes]|uniref:Uncharacterized protein n=1 Tax=Nephila pilipes TaxID=299642 RepID=A0A8X6TYS3_NEPPI|nr:hypothetical protein NPIL_162391 [Nephila pilipes]
MFLQWSYPALACHKISSDRVNTYSDTASAVAFVDVFLRNGFGSFYSEMFATLQRDTIPNGPPDFVVLVMGRTRTKCKTKLAEGTIITQWLLLT